MGDGGEQDPPGGPSHRTVGDQSEPVRHHEAREHEQCPENGVHAERPLLPPVLDRIFGERRVDDDDQQRHAAHHGEDHQHGYKGERPVPPSLRDGSSDPHADVVEPPADRGELLSARVDPFGQHGHEGGPSALHDDGEQRHREHAHAHSQREQDPLAPLALSVGFPSEPFAFRRNLLFDLFGDVLAYPFPLVVEFRPVGFKPGFVLPECVLAFEDAFTAFFSFGAGAFPPFGFFEQSAGLVEF